jgi:hypothetical protein
VRAVTDRREAYYAKLAKVIAADPLDFYTRAEAGRRFQTRLPALQAKYKGYPRITDTFKTIVVPGLPDNVFYLGYPGTRNFVKAIVR